MIDQTAVKANTPQRPQIVDVYEEWDFIDAKDNMADWRVGIIVEKNDQIKQMKVRFDGWPSKYDEYYKFGSPKLQHFRTITLGYTGQKVNPAIRPHWKFSLEEHLKKLDLLKDFMKKGRFEMKGYELTQYLRGKHYIYIDCLLETTFTDFVQLKSTIEYFKTHIDLMFEYLNILNPTFEHAHQDPILFNQAAFENSYFEIFDACTSIFGGYRRINAFYKKNQKLLFELKEIKMKPSATTTSQAFADFYIRYIYVAYFVEKGGWNILENLFNKLLEVKTNTIPFPFLESLTSFYTQLNKFNLANKIKKYTDLLIEIVRRNLANVNEKTIKENDRTTISNASDKLITMLIRNSDLERSSASIANTASNHQQTDEIIKQIEMLDLKISYQYFKSPYFEKKLKGITCLKDSLYRIDLKRITTKEYYDWALSVGLSKQIFDDNTHVEIIKRASQIIRLFCQYKVLTNPILDIIWEARQDKHEATLKALDELLLEIVSYLTPQQIDYLFNKIIQVKVQTWDYDYLELVKRISQFAIKQYKKGHGGNYGIPAIYQYAELKQDEKSLVALFDLLNIPLMDKQLNQYKNICIRKIKEGINSFFHIQLFLRIERYSTSVSSLDRPTIEILIKDIIKNYNNISQLETRFQLLDCLLLNHHIEVSLEQKDLDSLWQRFKRDDKQIQGREIFLRWLCPYDQNLNYFKIKHYISSDVKQYFFKQILCNHRKNDFFNMNLVECNIFLAFFIDVNISHNKLTKAKISGAKFRTKTLELIGMNQLWGIFLNCQNILTIKRSAEFICDIHSKLSIDMEKSRHQIGMRLIDKAIEHITNGIKKQNHLVVKNFLMLLGTFINKIQGYFQIDENFRPRGNFPKQYTIINSATHQKVEIKFNIYLPFGLLRKKIGKTFNTDTRYFQLQHKLKTVISRDYDENPISQCSIGQNIHFIPCQPKQNYVKKYLNKHLELFLEMLTTPYAQEVWNIISILPVSSDMKSKIDEVKNWETFLQGGIYKELYLLRIIETMRLEEWERFIDNNGVKSITNKLNSNINQEIDIEFLKSLTDILFKCICSEKKDPRLFAPQTLNQISLQLIELVNKLIIYSIKVKDDGEDVLNRKQYNLGKNIFQILYKIKSYVKILVNFATLPNLESLLQNGLMRSPNTSLRQIFCTQLLRLIICQQKDQPKEATTIFSTVLFSLIDKIIQQQNTKIYFQFTIKLIERLDQNILQQSFKKTPNAIKRLIRFLDEDKGEQSFSVQSETYWGVTQLLKQIVTRKQLKIQEFDEKFLANYILNQCLFEFKNNQILPKCKTETTRTSAFQLLWSLISNNKELVHKVVSYLSELNKIGHWRNNKWTQWVINPKSLQKSSTNYVGLKNLGCICYMNSFLQQIFMIKSFRQEILNAEDPLLDKVKQQDNLLYQLKSMFIALEQSDEQYYNPKPFTFAFKDYDGKPTNVLEQMDIDQFSGFLLDKLETQLKGSKNASNVINNHFSGIISNEIICKGCPHYSENKQPFVSLGLQVKNKEDIYESLDALIKGEMLEGQNAYHCERCSKKVSALKRGCIKQLPNHLIIALKRFQFNYQTMTKSKINDYCKFPHQLNLQKYSQNYLRKTENNDNKFGEDEQLVEYPPEYYEYQLKGVVIHLGFADNGHYYSYIQDRDGTKQWFQFNDTVVRKFDVDNLANQAFGGEQKAMDLTLKEKNRNAYLLFYDRKVKLDSQGNPTSNKMQMTKRSQLPYLEKFISDLKVSNQKYYLFRLIFSQDYDEFIKCILNNPNLLDEETNTELLNFVLLYFLTKTIRMYSKKLAYEIGEILVEKAKTNTQFALRILKVFSQQSTILELLKYNPLKQMRKLLVNFVIQIARIAYKIEAEGANNRLFECVEDTGIPTTALGNFINALMKSGTSGKILQFNNQIYMILAKIAEFGPQTAEYFLRKRTLFIILTSLLEKQIKNKPQFQTQPEQNSIGKMAIDDKQALLINIKNKNKKQEQKTYVWYLLSELLKHCDLKLTGYPKFFTSTKFPLPNEQLQLVYLTPTFIYNTLSEVKCKLMMRKVIKYICTICIQNPKLTDQIPQLLIKGLKALQSSKYRGLLMFVKHFIRIPDKLMERRMGAISNQIKIGLEENRKYSVELDVISQWYIKFARKNPQFRKYIRVHNSTLKLIHQLNRDRQVPEQIAKKHMVICDKIYHVLHGVMMLKSEYSYSELSKFKDKEITALLQGTELPVRADEGWDSDDDLEDKQLVKDQTVMAFVDKGILNFVEMKIVGNILNRLTLDYNGEQLGFWKDDELLTLEHKVITFDETRVNLLCQSEETASIGSFNEPDP